MKFDLLSTVEQGGCSAKLPATELNKVLKDLPAMEHANLLVSIDTHDDAGVYKIRDDYALIQTTDFFPPVCSEAYDFGQIAAANALSDVYAMGGQVLTALNLAMFPANLPLDILKEILKGGQDKVAESGGVIVGGHTIADDIPKYGLAVSGWVHPDNLTTNSAARPGEVLILTKPIGTGTIISAKRIDLCDTETYLAAINNMKQLNKEAAVIMNKHGVKCATDITGFGLLGHIMKLAEASDVSASINASVVPSLPRVMEFIEMGCIPGAAFRNLDFIEDSCSFDESIDYNTKMFLVDAQTSGGILMSVKKENSASILEELLSAGYPASCIVGEVGEKEGAFTLNIKR
jgi:selenide,water dikinase